jgi:hypothetical protein
MPRHPALLCLRALHIIYISYIIYSIFGVASRRMVIVPVLYVRQYFNISPRRLEEVRQGFINGPCYPVCRFAHFILPIYQSVAMRFPTPEPKSPPIIL